MNQVLKAVERMALQYFGMDNSEILKMHLHSFEQWLKENSNISIYSLRLDSLSLL